eukprot:2171233-Rhodomonas_salina.1
MRGATNGGMFRPTLRNQLQKARFAVGFVPGRRLLAIDFAGYVLSTQCPVLSSCMGLRACYAMSGSDIAYRATRRNDPYASHASTSTPYVLCIYYAMFGTDVGRRRAAFSRRYPQPRYGLHYQPTRFLCDACSIQRVLAQASTSVPIASALPPRLRQAGTAPADPRGHEAAKTAVDDSWAPDSDYQFASNCTVRFENSPRPWYNLLVDLCLISGVVALLANANARPRSSCKAFFSFSLVVIP